MPRLCSFGCEPSDAAMHCFPNYRKFPEHFKTWVKLCGGKLQSEEDYDYYRKQKVCDRHFVDRDHNRNKRLNCLAVPSMYLSVEYRNHIEHNEGDGETAATDESQLSFSWLKKDDKAVTVMVSGHETENEVEKEIVTDVILCNMCQNVIPIGSIRVVCVTCWDFDMCVLCAASDAHSEHYALRVPSIATQREVREVLQKVRQSLIEKHENFEDDDCFKVEVKQEEDDPIRVPDISDDCFSNPDPNLERDCSYQRDPGNVMSLGDDQTIHSCEGESDDDVEFIDESEAASNYPKKEAPSSTIPSGHITALQKKVPLVVMDRLNLKRMGAPLDEVQKTSAERRKADSANTNSATKRPRPKTDLPSRTVSDDILNKRLRTINFLN